MKTILLIHPYDKSTRFLKRIKNHLVRNLSKNVHYFSVKPTETSHTDCLSKIEEMPSNSFVIFMGHSRSTSLFGGKSDDYGTYELASPEALEDNLNYINYFNDTFITEENLSIFKDKIVFCLSCNSKFLGEKAILNGTKGYIGFGDIPASEAEFKVSGCSRISKYLVAQMKSEINLIMKTTILEAIVNSYTLEQLYNSIIFFINKRIAYHLVEKKRKNDRYLLTDYLYFIKKDICLYGDRNSKITYSN